MLKNIWRYSHFGLAISSSIFIIIASITGIILAFEPIDSKVQPFKINGVEEVNLSAFIDTLKGKYEEVIDIEINENLFVKASVFSMDEELSGDFYIHPFTGEKIGEIPKKLPIFEWTTNFHRSLFLKTPGRIFIGITSFFLFLISITGIALLIKRQRGFKKLFSKIIKDDFYQYYHVIFGRLTLIPIVIISLTGVYLSLHRFELIPEAPREVLTKKYPENDSSNSTYTDVFKQITLDQVKKVEFPFSPDEEDYYTISLHNKDLIVHQYSGAIIEEVNHPIAQTLKTLTFNLHTGSGSILWSIILGITSLNILFFIYSGAIISFKRLRSSIKNKYNPEDAEYFILIGSENGGSKEKAIVLQQALLKQKVKVYLGDLNAYRVFPRITDLIILTSTYGEGDPPSNADQFLELLQQHEQANDVRYAVLGFGSMAYQHFCQFAKDVDQSMQEIDHFKAAKSLECIHNQSYQQFRNWANEWAGINGLVLELPVTLADKKEKSHIFRVDGKTCINDEYGETFTIEVTTPYKRFESGDLLGIKPSTDTSERWYSIAKIDRGKILLSVKKHDLGLCSNFLYDLKIGRTFTGTIKRNPHFHFPKKAKEVILIANGTGLAPFIGMIQNNPKQIKTTLYWGGRTFDSYHLYKDYIQDAIQNKKLHHVEIAYSRTNSPFNYVQDIIVAQGDGVVNALESGAVIMICGAIKMQNDVLQRLEENLINKGNQNIDHYIKNNQILMDCY